jgi:hypothetical protein
VSPKRQYQVPGIVIAKRIRTLRAEGFTKGEIVILMDRRISSPGVMKLRRERAKELKGLTTDEKEEWAVQNEEARDEETAIADLRRVSPEF